MTYFMKDLLIDIKDHLGPILKKLGLKLTVRGTPDEGIQLQFYSPDMVMESPVIVSLARRTEPGQVAKWSEASMHIDYIDRRSVGTEGWYWENASGMSYDEDWDGVRTSKGAMTRLKHALIDYEPWRQLPGPNFTTDYDFASISRELCELVRIEENSKVVAERDEDGVESYLFGDSFGHAFRLAFEPQSEQRPCAVLYVDSEEVGRVRTDDARKILSLVTRHFDINPDCQHLYGW